MEDEKKFFPRDGEKKIPIIKELFGIDRRLIPLIAKRSELVQKLLATKKTSFAAKKVAEEEKDLRKHWENESSAFSHDERFLRQIFSLLQEIEIYSSEAGEDPSTNAFNMAPAKRAAHISLPFFASARQSQLWIALSAAANAPLKLPSQLLGDENIELIKALNQAGASLFWDDKRNILSRGSGSTSFADKTIYAGNSSFNFYFLSALAASSPGVVKFTGDSALKLHNFSVWRNTLPLLGARLAHLIPKSTGLPVHQECSGLLPEEVELPENLPQEALIALVVAALFWENGVTFTCNPSLFASGEFDMLMATLKEAKANIKIKENKIIIKPAVLDFPSAPNLVLDDLAAFFFLAVPAFCGGNAKLQGAWPETNDSTAMLALLSGAGLDVKKNKDYISTSAPEGDALPATFNASLGSLPQKAIPLALALAAKFVTGKKRALPLPELEHFLSNEQNYLPVQEFLSCLNLGIKNPASPVLDFLEEAAGTQTFTAPRVEFGMALALMAYLKPHLGLTNAGIVSSYMPIFWTLYNTLPVPLMEAPTTDESHEPKRRRIITR